MTATDQPARRTEYLPLDALKPDPRNPKAHDVETIDGSVGRFGIIDQITRDDRTGYIISGHGRTKTLRAMRDRGESPPDGVQVTADGEWLVPVNVGWASRSDAEAGAALIALNRTTELGGWVDDALLDLLDDLSDVDDGFVGVGFGEDDLEALRESLAALEQEGDGEGDEPVEEEPDGRAPTTGEMLSVIDVAYGEPAHKPHHGEVWQVGRHRLVIARVHDEHAVWTPLLAALGPDAVLAPYPEPYLTTGTLALERPLLLVQPNTYLAGHLLDKHASAFPSESVERIEGAIK